MKKKMLQCIFNILELSSNLGNNRMLTKRERERERERLVKEIKCQLNKLISNY